MSAAAGLDRREALKLLAAGLAMGLASCQRPDEEIVPWVFSPDGTSPDVVQRYSTTLTLGGYGRGIVGLVRDGRPIKLEGNPRHPASLGATDVFAEAAVLDLFDPQRSRAPSDRGEVATWEMLDAALFRAFAGQAAGGEGIRLLTGRLTSPTALRLIAELKARHPALRHHRYEPVHDDNERAAARLAFGRQLQPMPRLYEADVIVALDADPLGPGPDQVRWAREWSQRRRPERTAVSRMYVLEPSLTLTGACADRRAALSPEMIGNAVLAIARELGAAVATGELPPQALELVRAATRDLLAARGRAVVLVGRGQPPQVHAMAHWINARLGAPVSWLAPIDPVEDDHAVSLAALAGDMHEGRVSTLIMLGCNPVYDAPAQLGFVQGMSGVPLTVHAGLFADETAAASHWHAPLRHELEDWSDARATDGTASIGQPLIRPLYDGRGSCQFLAGLDQGQPGDARALVQATWLGQAGANPAQWWRDALVQGLIANSGSPASDPGEPRLVPFAPARPSVTPLLQVLPSATVWDGRQASNAWLQECPEPLTKEVWGASLRISAKDAARWRVRSGQLVRVTAEHASMSAPVLVADGQAEGIVSLPLGYGRLKGQIAKGLGANAAALRGAGMDWVRGVRIEALDKHAAPQSTQGAFELDGELAKLFPVVSPGQSVPPAAPTPSLLPPVPAGEYAWAMAIDTSVCIGCNACVVACQAENNVPVIGPEEIAAGRDMHWLRVDRYDHGSGADPRPGFQPVPCMQCERAPCEPVCPVAASVHDHQGLNVQVYNRCIGTRDCEANCPYKVRRFNFRDYAEPSLYGDLDTGPLQAQRNPEVTVRARGVMEKCTYCIQRIETARQDADRTGRKLADGEVKTACQVACPTNAIVFGDKNDPRAEVSKLKAGPRHYALLGELGTRPRTTYLAKVRNPGEEGQG